MSITLSEAAAKHVEHMLAQNLKAEGLRLGVRKSGCTGYAYVIDFSNEITDQDHVFDQHGVKVVVNKEHLPFLDGVEVDYKKTGLNASFHFTNPNVTDTCGCGESFAIKEVEN